MLFYETMINCFWYFIWTKYYCLIVRSLLKSIFTTKVFLITRLMAKITDRLLNYQNYRWWQPYNFHEFYISIQLTEVNCEQTTRSTTLYLKVHYVTFCTLVIKKNIHFVEEHCSGLSLFFLIHNLVMRVRDRNKPFLPLKQIVSLNVTLRSTVNI